MRLTVKQLKNREPGSGMAVIDREALSELGVSSGDFVAIEGRADGGAERGPVRRAPHVVRDEAGDPDAGDQQRVGQD